MFDTADTSLLTGLVFVDSSVGDYAGLIESIGAKLPAQQTRIYTLDALADGVQKISQTLALYGEGTVSSIHVFSHGDVGQLQLGNMVLNSHSLSGYQDDLLGWQSALTADADLLFYGCNVAQGEAGRRFIDQIGRFTGADVAASSNVTGNTAYGGDDWLLEYQTGAIEAQTFTGATGLQTILGRLTFESNKLLFADIGLSTDSSLSIQTTANHLIVSDANAIQASTGIADLDVSNNSVTIAWSALAGMTSFEINAGGGEDSVTFQSNLFLNGANLEVIAEAITVQDNVIISTRQVAAEADHTTANSTGNSGTIRLGSDAFGDVVKTITIGAGANLLTHTETGSSHQAADIQLYANYLAAAAAENLSPINWITKTTTINIGTNATLRASSIDIKAQSEDKTLGDLLGANALIDSFVIEPLQERLAEALALPVKFLVRKSEALVTVGSGAKLIGADDVSVDAIAITQSKGQAKGSHVSIGYVQASSTAKVNVLSGAVIEAGGDVSIGSEGKAEAAIATETEGTKSSSFGISLAVNHTDIVSHVSVAQGASIVAGKSANIIAYGNNSAEAEAASKTGKSGKASFAFGITLTNSDIKADVDGAITAYATAPAVAEGDDEDKPEPVTGIGIVAKLKTSDSAVAATERSDGEEPAGPDASVDLFEKIGTIFDGLVNGENNGNAAENSTAGDNTAGSGSQGLALAGALGFAYTSHQVLANVGSNAVLKSGEDLTISATLEHEVKLNADSDIAGAASSSGSAAVVVGIYNDDAKAIVNSNAKLDADKITQVTATVEYPFLTKPEEYIPTSLDDLVKLLEEDGYGAVNDYLDGTLGLKSKLLNTWARSTASGENVGVSGSVNLLIFNNDANAIVAPNVAINQDVAWRTREDDLQDQSVSVEATNHMQLLNLTGVFQFLLPSLEVGLGTAELSKQDIKLLGADGKSGIGGAFFLMFLNNTTQALVDSGTAIFTGDRGAFSIKAEEAIMNFNFTQSGGKGSGSYGIAGSFAYVNQDSTTVARLAEGVTITGPSVDISAASLDTHINWVGGVAVGKSLGFGVTVSINDIDRKTYAIIGSANPFAAGFDPTSIAAYPAPSALTSIAVTDFIKVNARSDGWLGAFSVAAAVADGNPKPPTTTQTGSTGAAGAPTGQNNQPTSAIGLSGNVSFNQVTDHVQSFVYDAGQMQANQVEVTAFNNTGLYAIGGAVAFAKAAPGKTSVGLAGAAGWNEVGGTTKAYIYGQGAGQKLTLTANGLRVDAQSGGNIFAITAGGSGAMGGQTNVSLAGSFSYNEINRATASFVEGVNATLNGGGGAQPALLTNSSQVQTSSSSLDTIVFENSLDWITGTAVKYDNGGGTSIAGLNTTSTYYVVVDATNPKLLRLASDSAGNNIININPGGATGEGHRLYLASTPTSTTAIDLGSEHGWSTGDAVVYNSGNGKAIGGLEDGETYYVIRISDTQLRLARTSGGSAIVMDFTKATGGQHSLHRKASDGNSYSLFEFTPAEEEAFALYQVEAKDRITLSQAHGFIAGQALTYDNGGGTSLGGLTHGGTYYAIVDAGSPTSFRLAASKEDAELGIAITMNPAAMTGANHQFLPQVHVVKAEDSSRIFSVAGTASVSLGSTKSGGGFGFGFAWNDIQNTTTAVVKNSQLEYADSLQVLAHNDSKIQTVSASVGVSQAQKTAATIAGTASVNQIDNLTHAQVVSSTLRGLGGATSILAQDKATIQSISGAVSVAISSAGPSLGFGAAVAYNAIGNRAGHQTLATVDSSTLTVDSLTVKATSDQLIQSIAAAAAAAVSGKAAVSLAGAVTINDLEGLQTQSSITGSTVTAAEAIKVVADNTSEINSIAGQVAIAVGSKGGGALGAAVAINDIGNGTDPVRVSAFIDSSTVTSATGAIDLLATSGAKIWTISAGVQAAGGAAFGGALGVSLSLNTIETRVSAVIANNSAVTAETGLTVQAEDQSLIQALAGQAAIAAGKIALAIGTAIAENDIKNTITAYIADSTAQAKTGSLTVSAKSTATIESLSAVGAVSAGKFSGSAAVPVSHNQIRNTIEAHATNAAMVSGATGVNLLAADESTIKSLSGGAAIAISIGVGAGVASAYNNIDNTVRAYSSASNLGSSAGNVLISADAKGTIQTIAAAFGASGIAGVAGSIAINEMANQVTAYTSGGTITAQGSVGIFSQSRNTVDTKGGAIGGGAVGVGGTVVVNNIDNQTRAYSETTSMAVKGQSTLSLPKENLADGTTTIRGLGIVAINTETVNVLIGTASLGGVGLAGTVAVNSVENTTQAYLHGGTINGDLSGVHAEQSVLVKAFSHTMADVKAGSLAIGSGSVGIGVTLDVTSVKNTTTAGIGAGAMVNARQDVEVLALSRKTVDSTAVAGGGGGFAGVAGSVSVMNIGSAMSSDGASGSSGTSGMLTAQISELNQYSSKIRVDASIINEFNTGLAVNHATQAYIGAGTTVNAGRDITVRAEETSNIHVLAGALSVGLTLGAGGAAGVVNIIHNVKAWVDSGAQLSAGRNITVDARGNVGSARTVDTSKLIGSGEMIETYTGSGGLVGLGAAVSYLDVRNNVEAVIQSTTADPTRITRANTLSVTATGSANLTTRAAGASVGAVAAGIVFARTLESGQIRAAVGDGVQIGQVDGLTVNNLTVQAQDNSTVSAKSQAAAGGLLSGIGSNARASLEPTVIAEIGANTAIKVSNDITVNAIGSQQAKAEARGSTPISGVSVSSSQATAIAKPTLRANIGSGSTLNAGNNLTVQALNTNQSNLAEAVSSSSSGALLVGIDLGTGATTETNATVTTTVGGTLIVGNTLTAKTDAYNGSSARADGTTRGLLAGGATQTIVTATTNAVTTIAANAVINAGNRADITSVANTVVRTRTDGNTGTSLTQLFTNLVNGNFSGIGVPSILASGGAGSGITVNNKAQTILEPNASVNATNQVNITADADTSVRPADGQEFSAAMTTQGATLANAFAITDVFIDSDALIDIRQGAKVAGLNVNIDADNQISALAAARGNALVDIEGAHGSAFTRLNIGTAGNYSEAKISFATATDIIGTDSLRIDATNSQKDGNLRSRAQGRGESNLFVGIATARSEGTAYVQSIVESASGSAMRSGDLSVNAESNYGLDRDAETISSTLVTKTLKVIREVTQTIEEKVCEWMPWPLDELCSFVTRTITKLVESLENVFVAAASHPSQGGLGVVLNGNGTYRDTINLNGDLYNIGSSNQSLKVNADGSIDATSTIGTSQDANNIYVDDIVSDAKMSMKFSANRGQIIGNAVMRVNKNIEQLTVENRSGKNLVFGKINLVGFDEAKNDSKFSSANNGSYAFASSSGPSTVNIVNAANAGVSNSNLVFNRSFSNLGGFTNIVNQRGSILAGAPTVTLESGNVGHLNLAATNGDVGSSGNRFQVQLVRGKVAPDGSFSNLPAELIAAGRNIYLGITGININTTAASVPDGFALHLTATDDIDAVINRSMVLNGRARVNADFLLDANHSNFVAQDGIYNLVRADSANGDVSITGVKGDLVLGPLGGFLGPNGEAVNSISGLHPTLQNELRKGLVSASQGRVSLQATGTIRDDADGIGLDILAQEAVLRAGTTLGSSTNALETQIANLAAQADGAGLWLNNTGNLTLGAIAGLDGINSAGDVTLTTTGSLTVNARARANNALWLRTVDAAIAGQDITLTDQARLESTTGTIDLLAGDNLTVAAGATVTSAGLLTLVGDHTDADPGVGVEINLHGSLNAPQVNVFGGGDSDTVNLSRAVSSVPLAIQTLGGNDIVNLGSNASTASNTGGVLDNISGPITLDLGTGTNRLSLDDSGDTTTNSGTLTANTITGLGMATGITYANVSTLEMGLGSGSDSFTIVSTHAGQTTLNTNNGEDAVTVASTAGTTTVNTGGGNDTITVGNPSNVVSEVDGLLILDAGADSDQIFLNNSGDTTNNSSSLTNTTMTGLGMAQGIQYANAETLEINLGSGSDAFTIASTHTNQTTVNSGAGNDTVTAQSIAGLTFLNTQAGNDTVNIQAMSAEVFVDAGSEDDTINVGSPTGLASTIAARLTVDGNDGVDALNLTDIGSLADSDGVLTSTRITGLGMAVGIDYTRLENLTIGLGAGNNSFTVESTHAGQSTLNSGAGDDTVVIHTIAGNTNINTEAGNDQITVSNPSATLHDINAELSVDGGSGFDRMYLNNSGDTAGTTGVLTPNLFTLTSMAGRIRYFNLEDLPIDLGDGNDTFTIEDTHAGQTTLQTRGGNDEIYVHAIAGITTVDAGTGDDTITVGNPAQLVDNIRTTLNLFGREGTDTLYVLDSGDTKDNVGVLNDTWMAGLGMGDRLNYTTFEVLSIDLGQANDQFTVNSVGTGLSTLNAGNGNDVVLVNLQSLPEPGIFVFNGQGGDDLINASTATVGLVFNGDDDNDTIRGGSGHDLIGGGAGSDELVGNDGNDEIYGDSTFPNRATDAAYEDFTFPGDAMTAPPATRPMPVNQGSQGNDVIIGGTGTDTVYAEGGNDTVIGGSLNVDAPDGVDYLYGGAGDDQLIGDNATLDVSGNLIPLGVQGGADLLFGDSGTLIIDDRVTQTLLTARPEAAPGSDLVHGGVDDDLLLGDEGHVVLNATGQIIQVKTEAPTGGNDTLSGNEGDDIALGGAGHDQIAGDAGHNQLLGDNGQIIFADGQVQQIASLTPDIGGHDYITAAEGNDTILGGAADDTINAGSGNNIVLGDSGTITYTGGILAKVESIATDIGGNDTIATGEGNDTILGGFADDTITTPGGDNIVLGDSGLVDYSLDSDLSTLDFIQSIAPAEGGHDHITAAEGQDTILGGAGDDAIHSGAGDDIVLGDNGQVNLLNNQVQRLSTLAPELGGNDVISSGTGDDIILGGAGNDVLRGNQDRDIILGDNGIVDFAYGGDGNVGADSNLATLDYVATTDTLYGGNDLIEGGLGDDTLLGGVGSDTVFGDGSLDMADPAWVLLGAADFNQDGQVETLWRHQTTGQLTVQYIREDGVAETHSLNQALGDLAWSLAGLGDLNGDGHTDLLWRHSGGQVVAWLMNGHLLSSGSLLGTTVDSGWQAAGLGDLNGDGKADVLWRHTTTGEVVAWLMDGLTISSGSLLSPTVGLEWRLAATGDLNNDGKADLLWQHRTAGTTVAWLMNGLTLTGGSALSQSPDANWQLQAVGDLNGDDRADLIWRHITGSQTVAWFMDGLNLTGGQLLVDSALQTQSFNPADGTWQLEGSTGLANDPLGLLWRNRLTGQIRATSLSNVDALSYLQLESATVLKTQVADLNWQIASTADFNGDGEGDLLWRHQISGETVLWFVKDGALASGGLLSDSAPPIWQLQGAGDLDGDDRPELIWRHSITGDLAYWQLDGTTLVGGGAMDPLPDLNWQLRAVDDFNQDGRADLLWRHTTTGQLVAWYMHRAQRIGADLFGTSLGDLSWQIAATCDLNGDGHTDLVWQHQNGSTAIWFMNGVNLLSGLGLNGYTDHDLMLGDQGSIYQALPADQNYISNYTNVAAAGGNDVLYGQSGDDIMLGQQGTDTLQGGAGDDMIIGGHNVIGGSDAGDVIEGGTGSDAILGDNGTITRRFTSPNTWQRYYTGDTQYDVLRFDDVEALSGLTQTVGHDTIAGGAGNDVIYGQRGNDVISGNEGDDELHGGLGDDTLRAGNGHDTVLGDVGIIARAYNADGTPRLRADGSWHRDVILTPVGTVTATLPLGAVLPEQALNADLLLLTGAPGASASLQLISLLADGNDVIYGDAGNNQLFGQGGNDVIFGGTGNDYIEGNAGHDQIQDITGDNLIIGDNSRNLASFDTQRPVVQQGLHLIQANPATSLALAPFGQVVLPHLEVAPSLVQGLLPTVGLSRSLTPDNSPIPSLGNLVQKDGLSLTPLASIIPTLAGHRHLLPGNDTLSGGSGRDTIIGDSITQVTPLRTGNPGLDLEIDRLIRDGQQLSIYLQDLELQRDYYYRSATQTYFLGADIISGGDGDDYLVGDNQVIQGPYRVEAPATASNLATLVGQLRQGLTSYSTAINGLRQSLPVTGTGYQPHTFNVGTDTFGGNGGNNTIIGDDNYVFTPILGQLPYRRDSFWQYSFGDQLSSRTQPLRNYNLNLGNDTVTGGTGQDLMIGDYGMTLAPIVNQAPQTAEQSLQLQQSLDLLLSDLQAYIRDLHNNTYGIDFNQENQANSLRAGNDQMNGIDGNDLMLGDNATMVLPFIAGSLNLGVPLQHGILDLRVSDHNLTHALPRRVQFIYRQAGVGFTELSQDGLYGGTGNDVLFGLNANDALFGQEGNDFLFGGLGSNTLDGGAGSNTVRTGNPGRADEAAIAPDIQAKLAAMLSPALLTSLYETISSQASQQLEGQLSGRITH